MRTEWNSLRKLESPGAHSCEVSGGTPYTSLRLQVESTSVSSRMPLERSSSEARRACSAVNDTRSRTSTGAVRDRKSTRLNSSHQIISYAVFCLKKKKK